VKGARNHVADRVLDLATVDALRSVALRFGPEHHAAKARALAAGASSDLTEPAALLAYHDCLLCLAAYPETRQLLATTRRELRRVAAAAHALYSRGPARGRAKLANTGVAGTEVTINFGWDIARWLVARFPRRAELDSFGDDGVPPPQILAESLAPMEFELAASEADALEFIAAASAGGRKSRLAWLVDAVQRLPCSDALRATLWDAMQPFIVIRTGRSLLSRTFARGLPAPTYYHREALPKRVDLRALVDEPLPAPRRLERADAEQVVDVGRAVLAALGRETDAIALTYPQGVRWYDLARGTAVALYAIRPERRAVLDSHIGMMLFKNGVPVGYGGGWPFLDDCRIGVNIFAAFRGGESALLFGQVLRVYRQCFGVGRFIAEPSQFGGTNREGLRSGAFWFYYRLGFRPVDADAARRAGEEWSRMGSDPRYRTPEARLRRFTDSDIELRLDPTAEVETSELSHLVTAWIGARFGGDRNAAVRFATDRVARVLGATDRSAWRKDEADAFEALSPLVAQIPRLREWSEAERRSLVRVMRAQGGDPFRFHDRLRRHRRFAAALAALAGRAR
jgi:hypothetical protein